MSPQPVAHYPMSFLGTAGPAADPVTSLGYGLGAIASAVTLIIAILLLVALTRLRPLMREASGHLAIIREQGGLRWIYIGVGISTLVLFASAVWSFQTMRAVSRPAQVPDITLTVTARQWWWQVNYRRDGSNDELISANELHVPVGRPVLVKLQSPDVIHSFWVPQLSGKMDAVPGQTNVLWLQAERPGRFRGQCAEYCGLQHAHMALYVIAESPEAFDGWWQNQRQGHQAATATEAHETGPGQQVFERQCVVCHQVQGTTAYGKMGPDLTHLMSRRTIAAGLLPNTSGNLAGWIANPQSLKPGCRMPNPVLSGGDIQTLLAYMNTLQ